VIGAQGVDQQHQDVWAPVRRAAAALGLEEIGGRLWYVDQDERQTDLETAWEMVETGKMPKWFYVYPLHLGARLSDADKAVLKGYFLKGAAAKTEKAEAKADDAKTGTKE